MKGTLTDINPHIRRLTVMRQEMSGKEVGSIILFVGIPFSLLIAFVSAIL